MATNPPAAVQDHPLMEEKAALEAMNRELSQMIQKMNTISGRPLNMPDKQHCICTAIMYIHSSRSDAECGHSLSV